MQGSRRNNKPKIFFLVGPTAIGKTEVAVYLAKRINAEIISCDSMQIYKGMDIITSKPLFALQKRIPHYLIDVVFPTRQYNVSMYRREAVKKIRDIVGRGRVPLLVGGTGLYVSMLVDGIFKTKVSNKNIREQLYKKADKFGSEYLHKILKTVDLSAAFKIHPNDTKRIVRALEVFKSTGKPISQLQKERKGLRDSYDIKIFCLNTERDILNKRIEKRIDKMFAHGLLNEAKRLLKLKLSRTASYAIGIKELKGYFDGLYDLEEAKRLMKRNTRLYAKRQLTWFKKDKQINWIDIGDKDTPRKTADRIFKIWKKLS